MSSEAKKGRRWWHLYIHTRGRRELWQIAGDVPHVAPAGLKEDDDAPYLFMADFIAAKDSVIPNYLEMFAVGIFCAKDWIN